VLGSLVSAVIVYFDWPWWDSEHLVFAGRAETKLWFLFLIGQGGVWVALQLPGWNVARSLAAEAADRRGNWVGTVLLAACVGTLVGAGFATGIDYDFRWHGPKVAVITALGLLATAPAILAIWRVHRIAARLDDDLERTRWDDGDDRDTWKEKASTAVGWERAHPLAVVGRLRELLDRALVHLGVILGAAIASTAAFRNAVVASKGLSGAAAEREFPIEYVLLYGAFFSLLLASFYVPTYLRLQLLARDVITRAIPLHQNTEDWEDGLERRQKLEAVLKLDTGVMSSLTAGAAILAPLATSLVGLLLSPE